MVEFLTYVIIVFFLYKAIKYYWVKYLKFPGFIVDTKDVIDLGKYLYTRKDGMPDLRYSVSQQYRFEIKYTIRNKKDGSTSTRSEYEWRQYKYIKNGITKKIHHDISKEKLSELFNERRAWVAGDHSSNNLWAKWKVDQAILVENPKCGSYEYWHSIRSDNSTKTEIEKKVMWAENVL